MGHRPVENKIMLITYPDSLGRNLKDLKAVLDGPLAGAVHGVHILPFFPSSGDRGFAPITYREVDPAFGTWDDVDAIGENYYLMFDYMINHISVQSPEYRDFLAKKDDSEYRDFFIRFKDFWENGYPTPEEDAAIYRRRIGKETAIDAHFADGSSEKVWCTFSDEQVDINIERSERARRFLKENMAFLAEHGCSLVRLDAFAYATKKAGTNCFFVEPQVWELMHQCREAVAAAGAEVLPEIHEHYFIQKKLAEQGYAVYDFQLPMLLLNALQTGKTLYLKNWLSVCSPKQYTTLDTHDGIGVVDVRYLMPDEEVIATKLKVYEKNPRTAKIFTELRGEGPKTSGFDTYQINCSFFSALGEDEERYLLCRAVQFFAPGIPQVYYVGLFAGVNDFALYEKTKAPRDVNRHSYTLEEIGEELRRPVVQRLLSLMRFRNEHPAFQGKFSQLPAGEGELALRWDNGADYALLVADFERGEYTIKASGGERWL